MHAEAESIRWIVGKTIPGLSSSDLDLLEQELASFVFFHLGSDADVEVRNLDSGLSFSFSHQRIESFVFELSLEEIHSVLENPEKLETFLLNQLTRHRRS